jgi:hypothetical protein
MDNPITETRRLPRRARKDTCGMNQTMNDLALLAIGLFGGFLLAVIAVLVYVLWSSARKMQHSLGVFFNTIPTLRDSISNSVDKLRGDVSVGLSKMDAEKMYAASIQLQRLVKSLGQQVDTMQKALYAQPPAPAIDWTPAGTGLDEEAADDARMIAERNRWAAMSGVGAGGIGRHPEDQLNDPLAGFSDDEKRQRTLEYFERRRAAQAGFPYPPASPASPFSPASTPPAAGSGAYASLLDEAASQPPAFHPAADFSGIEPEEGVELVDKGELS